MRRMLTLSTIVAGSLLLAAGTCKTPKPTSDNTPPELRWFVHNNDTGNDLQLVGDASLPAKRGESYKVTLKAIDSGGVHKITLGGTASWTCTQGNIGQNKVADEVTDVQNLNPDSNNQVLTSIILIRDTNLTMPCQSGFTFSGGTRQLFGTGENYFGGVTNAKLTFNVTP